MYPHTVPPPTLRQMIWPQMRITRFQKFLKSGTGPDVLSPRWFWVRFCFNCVEVDSSFRTSVSSSNRCIRLPLVRHGAKCARGHPYPNLRAPAAPYSCSIRPALFASCCVLKRGEHACDFMHAYRRQAAGTELNKITTFGGGSSATRSRPASPSHAYAQSSCN